MNAATATHPVTVNKPTPKDNLRKLHALTAEGLAARPITPCSVEGCHKPTKSSKAILCKNHYNLFLRTGSTIYSSKPYKPRVKATTTQVVN